MNQISQSRRRWYGATCGGIRRTSPGLPGTRIRATASSSRVLGVRAFDDHLVPPRLTRPERAIRVDEVERVERRVHRLAGLAMLRTGHQLSTTTNAPAAGTAAVNQAGVGVEGGGRSAGKGRMAG